MNEEKTEPIIIYAEMTPNPATMKFVANKMLIEEDGAVAQYQSQQEAQNSSPLAQQLFQFPFVESVFITSNFVTVAKIESVEWDMIMMELREFIREFLENGNEAVTQLPQEETSSQKEGSGDEQEKLTGEDAPSMSLHDDRIKELLNEFVRPAVEGDGGAIHFKSFDEGVVTVTLKGACSGCPSSTITLKNGIESLLKREIPEVERVEAQEL